MSDSAIQPWASLNLNSVLLILAFTLLSGLGDAAGFICASRVRSDGRFVWVEALKCIVGFQFGMLMYPFATKRGRTCVSTPAPTPAPTVRPDDCLLI